MSAAAPDAAAAGAAALDGWTVVHVGAGLALGALGISPWLGVGALVAFEVFEAFLRRGRAGGGGLFEPESARNVGGDIAAGLFGLYLARAVLG